MLKATKVRLYPTPEQELAIDVKQSGNKIIGIDLGLKDFAIAHDGKTVTKYANPKHLNCQQKNLARKQKKLSRKTKCSKSREKFRKLIAKVHDKIANSRQDFLHKLSRKLVNESHVIVVENLNVKGMVKNRKLSKAISDVGWGKCVNFIDYKLKQKGGELIEIDWFFPSSKTCSSCGHILSELSLDVREWDCPNCHTHHDRDENAALNIRTEGIRILTEGGGNPVFADGGCVRPDNHKVKGHRSVNSEAYTDPIRAV
ncbi:RNA-guided endonuclease TnpB family protein [Planktothrix sp. FACHB-1365]|uniref:RNA-guided endonuclease TnpB family protein n=1 Tax=Planktothrix sp. FACHB-1365 TaxID=2692855 RepID=UPI0028154371|nr:RNA-guided endonuclease TnpB family protein [Planktothrix sp. FACHB-1365]